MNITIYYKYDIVPAITFKYEKKYLLIILAKKRKILTFNVNCIALQIYINYN